MATDLLKSTANNARNLVKFSHITGMTTWFVWSFCTPLLFQHNMIMVESSDIVLMCACTCMHLLAGNVCACVCTELHIW